MVAVATEAKEAAEDALDDNEEVVDEPAGDAARE